MEHARGTKFCCPECQSELACQRDLFNAIYTQQLETGKAWAYKEMLRDLWHHDDSASATTYFKDWYTRVIHTKLEPMKTGRAFYQRAFAECRQLLQASNH